MCTEPICDTGDTRAFPTASNRYGMRRGLHVTRLVMFLLMCLIMLLLIMPSQKLTRSNTRMTEYPAQDWETKPQSLASLAKSRALLDRNPFLKRCHGAKPKCTQDGCDGNHRKHRATADGGGARGPSAKRPRTQAPQAEAARLATMDMDVGQLRAWFLAEKGKTSRHKSIETLRAAVIKLWPGTAASKSVPRTGGEGKEEEEEEEEEELRQAMNDNSSEEDEAV